MLHEPDTDNPDLQGSSTGPREIYPTSVVLFRQHIAKVVDAISYTIEREYKIIAYRVSPSDTLDEDLIVEDHRRETLIRWPAQWLSHITCRFHYIFVESLLNDCDSEHVQATGLPSTSRW